jgi:hypothetical protein
VPAPQLPAYDRPALVVTPRHTSNRSATGTTPRADSAVPAGPHLDHDDAVLVITGDAPAAALTFSYGRAPFRGSHAGACEEVDLGQRVATAHLQRIPAQEPLRVTGRGSMFSLASTVASHDRYRPRIAASSPGSRIWYAHPAGGRCRSPRAGCARRRSPGNGVDAAAGPLPCYA